MEENLPPAPLVPINEDLLPLGHTVDEVANWSDQSVFACVSDPMNLPKIETWVFNQHKRLLFNHLTTINLTRMESVVLDLLTNRKERVVSNEEILMKLNKDPDWYKGMPMCLSRLQAKFKKFSNGDPLLRSVRSRGYCLIQIVNSE